MLPRRSLSVSVFFCSLSDMTVRSGLGVSKQDIRAKLAAWMHRFTAHVAYLRLMSV